MKTHLILVLSAIFLIPLGGAIPMQGADVWYGQYIVFFSFLPIGISIVLWKFNKWMSLFVILCAISSVVGHNGTTFVLTQHPRSMLYLIQLCFGYLTIYQISRFEERYRKYLLWGIVGLFCLQGLWVVLQWLNLDPIWDGIGVYMTDGRIDDTVGFSGSHNQIGLFFAVTLPVVLALCPYLIPLGIFGLWCSTTTAAWVGGIIGVLFYGAWRFKKKAFFLIVPIILCSFIFYNNFENLSKVAIHERVDLIKHSVNAVESGKIVMKRGNLQKILD